jgi:hypothetical protein
MTATILSAPSVSRRAATSSDALHVERTDITFTNRRPDLVEIRVVVTNAGTEESEPTYAALSAAPLGAFVEWRPMAIVRVPGLEPGESFTVETQARQPRPYLDTPDRVPPRRIITALGADDDDDARRVPGTGTLARNLAAVFGRRGSSARTTGELPANPFDLLFRGNPHWAGNLNIFVGGRAVERHLAQALRVYPERQNMAMFIVGSRRDAYSFHFQGAAVEWDAKLFDLSRASSLLAVDEGCAVPVDHWITLHGHSLMILAMSPPANCSQESIEVHVTQRSTGETAIVEFSLDPTAAGPGCYVV